MLIALEAIVTTLDLYSHADETMQKEAAAKIDTALIGRS